jgi:acyl-coenzyme A synthetase/AMP-(fatty) acid ligase
MPVIVRVGTAERTASIVNVAGFLAAGRGRVRGALVEEVLLTHPAVREAAAVVGVPDPAAGKILKRELRQLPS